MQVKVVTLYNDGLREIPDVHLPGPKVHAFIPESSHYVQLFASLLDWTTQAHFMACSKRFFRCKRCNSFSQKFSSNTGQIVLKQNISGTLPFHIVQWTL